MGSLEEAGIRKLAFGVKNAQILELE